MQNKQRITEFGLALIATVCVGSAAAAPLDPQQFVAGWPLDVTGEETFYDLTLTHEVYRFGRSLRLHMHVLDVVYPEQLPEGTPQQQTAWLQARFDELAAKVASS